MPFIMSCIFFVWGFSLIFNMWLPAILATIGIFACLAYRSFEKDHGHYISVQEVEDTEKIARCGLMKTDNSLPLEYGTEQNKLNILGFWIFLGAEVMLFATLFATYFILEHRTGNGPSGAEIFELTPVLFETILLLTSSFMIGLGVHAMRLGKKMQ